MTRGRGATTFAALAGAALLLAGCANDTTEPATPSSAPTTIEAGNDLGKVYEFTKADSGAKIGEIKVTDITTLPTECVSDDVDIPGSTNLGVRIELTNSGPLAISTPGDDLLQVNDAQGFTQGVDSARIWPTCAGQFPKLADAPAPGKAAGWVFIESPLPDPSALVFGALVWDEGASLENLKAVPVKPAQAVIRLPEPAAAPAPAAAPTTTATTPPPPAPTTTTVAPRPAAPAAGQACDPGSDGWAKDSSGGQLRCGYFGGSTPKWVGSLPYVGVRQEGGACELGAAVAESPQGVPMVCVGEEGNATWMPGP